MEIEMTREEQTQKACERAVKTGDIKDLRRYMKLREEDYEKDRKWKCK